MGSGKEKEKSEVSGAPDGRPERTKLFRSRNWAKSGTKKQASAPLLFLVTSVFEVD